MSDLKIEMDLKIPGPNPDYVTRDTDKDFADLLEQGKNVLLVGPTGCVDADTEFLSPKGWIRIADYKPGTKVLQYNQDGSAEFVMPTNFIKLKADKLNLIQTKYGVNQCICDDHRVIYFLKEYPTKVYGKPFSEIKTQHNDTKCGFSGLFKTVFHPKIDTSIPLTDADLRVQVMVVADGHIPEKEHKCYVNLKKQRKINRAEKLLTSANIPFSIHKKRNGFRVFYFKPPMRCKEYTSLFYQCSLRQLEIITDEVLNWDGSVKAQAFFSLSKKSIDFIQYAFAACGKRSSIYTYSRQREQKLIKEFRVSIAHNSLVGIQSGSQGKKVKIKEYKTIDGFKYCFQVPSTYLVLRRGDRIFVTGNCGKTEMAREYSAQKKIPHLSFSCDGTMSFREIIGHHSFRDDKGGHYFSEGLFLKAIQCESTVCAEEGGSLDPKGSFMFHQILNDRQFYSIDAQKTYKVHSKCRFVMTTNEKNASYVGVRTMNTALLDRFVLLYLDNFPLSMFKTSDQDLMSFLIQLNDLIEESDAGTTAVANLSLRKLNNLSSMLQMGWSRSKAVKIAILNQLRFINPDLYDAAFKLFEMKCGKVTK